MMGIVLEINGKKAVVVSNEGTFLEIPAQPGLQAGDTVTIPNRRVSPAVFKALIAVAACLVVTFTAVFGYTAMYNAETALISIDVNPSIELSVNRFGNVISTSPLNEEAVELLSTVDLKGMSYSDAVSLLISTDGMEQYLARNAFMVFSVQANNAAWQEELLANLQSTADPYVQSHHENAVTEYFLVDGQMVADAHQHGVSAGKYVMLLELESVAPNVDISEYANHNVCDIQAEIETHRGHGTDESGPHHDGGQQGAPSMPAPAPSSTPPEEAVSSSSEVAAEEPPPPPPVPAQPSDGHDNGHGTHGGGHQYMLKIRERRRTTTISPYLWGKLR